MTTVDHSGVSDQGIVRYRNEDFIAHNYPEDEAERARKGSLFVVADGVGGHGAGDVASREAAGAVVKAYYASKRSPQAALAAAFNQANMRVFDLAIEMNGSHMQTTLSAIVIVGNKLHIAHVGDTRIYRIRPPGQAELLTQDHSEVAELVRAKILSPDKVRNHPRRSIITRSVGSQPIVRPMVRTDTVAKDDIFVLCTDGLWEPVDDAEICEIAVNYSPAEACKRLVELGIERKSTDNLSVQIIRVAGVAEDSSADLAKHSGWWERLSRYFRKRPENEGVSGSSLCNYNQVKR